MDGIVDALLPYEELNCSIQIIDDTNVQLIDVIRFSDCYITNRCALNLLAVEWAYLFGKKVISGVDIPIWQGERRREILNVEDNIE